MKRSGWPGIGAAQEGDGEHGAGQDQRPWGTQSVRLSLLAESTVSFRYGVAAECHLTVNCSLAVFRTVVVPYVARSDSQLKQLDLCPNPLRGK